MASLDPAPAAIEMLRLSVSECFVYQLPKFRAASGHRAEDWGLADPVLTGSLKVAQADETLFVRLYADRKDAAAVTGASVSVVHAEKELFAECPITFSPGDEVTCEHCVQAVADSSRYFVLRVVDPGSKKHAFIGCGFRERQVTKGGGNNGGGGGGVRCSA